MLSIIHLSIYKIKPRKKSNQIFKKFFFVTAPSAEFSSYKSVKPRIFHGRSKREIFDTRENVSISNYSIQLVIKTCETNFFFKFKNKITWSKKN